MKGKSLMFMLMACVGAAAFILNYAGLYQLAIQGGYSASVAWLLPFCVDAGAIVALLAWRTGFAPAKPSMQAAAGLMIGSVVLQVMQHLVAAGHLPNGWWLTVVVGGIPAIVLALIVHAVVQNGADVDRGPARSNIVWTRVVGPAGELATEPVQAVDQGLQQMETPVDQADDKIAKAARIMANGGGRGTVQKELGLENGYQARKLMDAAREYATSLNGSSAS